MMPNTTTEPARLASLRIDAMYAGYGTRVVLHGISMSVFPGEVLGLLGPNGAGKSTLLGAIAGAVKTTGRLWLNQREITNASTDERSRLGIGFMMQGARVFPNLTARENLELGCLGHPRSERARLISQVSSDCRPLDTLLARRAGLLSQGQRQLLALAMILVRQPSLLLLDEPTAGLAPRLAENLLALVQSYAITKPAAVVLVEQNVDITLRFAHRASGITGGTIAFESDDPGLLPVGNVLQALFMGTHETNPSCIGPISNNLRGGTVI